MRFLRRLRRLRRMRRRRWGRYRNAKGRTFTKRILVGRSYSETLRNKRDRHVYTFQVRRSGRFILETKGPAARTDTKCYLYKGRRMLASNDDSGYRLHCKLKMNLSPGTYQLVVRLALSTRAGPYRVSVRKAGSVWPGVAIARRARRRARRGGPTVVPRARRGRHWLGNMRRGSAGPTGRVRGTTRPSRKPTATVRPATGITLRPGLRSQAMTVRFDRTDLYTVKIPAAGTYIIETDGNLDTKCYLDDTRGGVVDVNDDSGDGANCKIQLRLPYGTYHLRVSIRTAGRFGPYGVSVRLKR